MAAAVDGKHLRREINEARVLDILRVDGHVARTHIASRSGLSQATITGITGRLLTAGLITEVRQGPSTGGRPPRILTLNPDGGVVVGVCLAANRATAVTVNLLGETVDRQRVPWRGRSPESAQRVVTTAVETLLARSIAPTFGLGLALSGIVDRQSGTVRHSGMLGWEDVPLGRQLERYFGLSVTTDRLVNALASALVLFGEGRGYSDLLVVSVGHSIGCGLVLGGRVHQGMAGPTGSLGHTATSVADTGDQPDRTCHCGNSGCLETVASEWALAEEVEKHGYHRVDDAVAECPNDARLQQLFSEAGNALGGAVANVAKVVNPQRIFLGGEGTRLGAAILDPFQKRLHRALVGTGEHDIELRIVATDDVTWAHGAACLSLATLFRPGEHPSAVTR